MSVIPPPADTAANSEDGKTPLGFGDPQKDPGHFPVPDPQVTIHPAGTGLPADVFAGGKAPKDLNPGVQAVPTEDKDAEEREKKAKEKDEKDRDTGASTAADSAKEKRPVRVINAELRVAKEKLSAAIAGKRHDEEEHDEVKSQREKTEAAGKAYRAETAKLTEVKAKHASPVADDDELHSLHYEVARLEAEKKKDAVGK